MINKGGRFALRSAANVIRKEARLRRKLTLPIIYTSFWLKVHLSSTISTYIKQKLNKGITWKRN